MSKTYAKTRRWLDLTLAVERERRRRRLAKLGKDELLSLYEEGSNLYFHGSELSGKLDGLFLLESAAGELGRRYPKITELDLTVPFALRNWMEGKVLE